MRFLLAIIAGLFFGLALESVRADETLPYDAIVIEDTVVRSGPATVHYATENALIGMEIKVFRHDPGGWCAIRPPANAFSMIPATDLKISKSGRWGKAISDQVKVWVGTSAEETNDPLWQVKIPKDEIVEIREAIKIVNGGHSEKWYRVSPPAGEFRWIKKSSLRRADRESRAGAFLKKTLVDNSLIKPRSTQTPINDKAAITQKPIPFKPSPITKPDPKKLQIAESELTTTTSNNDSKTPVAPSSGWIAKSGAKAGIVFPFNKEDQSELVQASADAKIDDFNETIQSNSDAGIDSSKSTDLSFASALRQLEVDLTLEILKPVQSRDFTNLRRRANGLTKFVNDQTNVDQSELSLATNFRNKVEDFAKLTKRSAELNSPSAMRVGFNEEIRSGATATDSNYSSSKIERSSEDDESPFDAVGFLNRLISKNEKVPNGYVLQDKNGNFTHIVSPSAGFNLRRYLKKEVGIIGKRGFHAKYKLPHIVAERVVLFEPLE